LKPRLDLFPVGTGKERSFLFFGEKLKIIFYIDGQNAHHTLKAYGIESHYFNYREFCADFVKNWAGISSVIIKYYGAVFPRDLDEYKHHRDNNHFSSLETDQKVVVRKGKINFDRVTKGSVREKGVDVLLAVDLIMDGFHNLYDQAIIFSDDTDLIPAIIEAKKIRSGVKVHNISKNPLHDFKKNCDKAFTLFRDKAKKFHKPQDTSPSVTMLKALEDKFRK
jgi:uncharacterized LabA/DUF88 family protein